MIRRCAFVVLALSTLAFPVKLSAQSAGSQRPAAAAAAPSPAVGGCFAFSPADSGGGSPVGTAQQKTHGFDLSNLDRSVAPCDDFYKFVDGGWMKDNPIPADRSTWAPYSKLMNQNEEELHGILEEAAKAKSAKPGSDWQKIGDYYASCMDETGIEAAGLKPLDPIFQQIAQINDLASLQAEIARLQRTGVNAVFGFGSQQDFQDSTQVIAVAGQGGLGLPDRQYYLDQDDHSKQIRAGYIQHVTNMFKLLGDDDATAADEAKAVMDIETTLAKASTKREDLRNPAANYHKLTLVQLADLTPHLSWADYFREVGAPPVSSADIAQTDFLKAVDSALVSVPLDQWKIYLRWHVIDDAAEALPQKFVDENFDFYSRQLTGAKQILPRWQRCVEQTDGELGEALGQFYVKRYFPPEAKARALVLVHDLIDALHDDLSTLDWMSEATRQQALHKLDAMTLKIGYPDKWRDYSAYQVARVAYVENAMRGDEFEFARGLAKIGKPVDRTEWHMSPPTVNAYYNPLHNEIVFPAGILQPPYFDPKADDAINYGSIGSIMGHEMTHGFDDQGAQFDADGNLKNWWTPDDLKNFHERGDCIVKEFDAFEVEPGLHENGKLEEGEAIADLGGLVIAHAAFEKVLAGKPAPGPIDGFTAEQRFFLGFGQNWSVNYRPEVQRLRAKTDPHPLNFFRVNGAVVNVPAFAKAWGCTDKSAMVKPGEMRCRIW
ncbi:MAG TPA: M13 family metallopeptidase [Candidatus Acidoferrales bacterium]|jgi:predicted metalloendopeptidase|nr:M13 family metallopeptidase [Candidatus Acidoferrales bacterium]